MDWLIEGKSSEIDFEIFWNEILECGSPAEPDR